MSFSCVKRMYFFCIVCVIFVVERYVVRERVLYCLYWLSVVMCCFGFWGGGGGE